MNDEKATPKATTKAARRADGMALYEFTDGTKDAKGKPKRIRLAGATAAKMGQRVRAVG